MIYERITTYLDVMGGVPCIKGLRFSVIAVVADGMMTDEILAEHPDVFGEISSSRFCPLHKMKLDHH